MASSVGTNPVHSPPVQRKRRSLAPFFIVAAIVGLVGFVLSSSTSGGAGMYNYALADLVDAEEGSLDGREIKVAGRIAVGSVRGEPASDSFRFDVEDDHGHKMPVAYTRLLPDPFEEGRDCILQGRVEDGVFHASNLTVKCPSRYQDAEGLTDAEREKYYKTDYRKHADMAAGAGAPAPTAAPKTGPATD
jgi:cytochrome c-type biogenesis protein CcmE